MGQEIAQLAQSMGRETIFATSDGLGGMPPEQIRDNPVLIAIGEPSKRQAVKEMLDGYDVSYTHLVASDKLNRVVVNKGKIIQQGAILTTNVSLGEFVFINLNVTVGHDCKIGDYTTVSPGANISGKVTIGKRCYIGTNASIREGVTICDDVTIGMGSVVLNDITEAGTYVGVPVNKIK